MSCKSLNDQKIHTRSFAIRITANKYVMPDIQQPLTW